MILFLAIKFHCYAFFDFETCALEMKANSARKVELALLRTLHGCQVLLTSLSTLRSTIL